jgi:hypothetical protein
MPFAPTFNILNMMMPTAANKARSLCVCGRPGKQQQSLSGAPTFLCVRAFFAWAAGWGTSSSSQPPAATARDRQGAGLDQLMSDQPSHDAWTQACCGCCRIGVTARHKCRCSALGLSLRRQQQMRGACDVVIAARARPCPGLLACPARTNKSEQYLACTADSPICEDSDVHPSGRSSSYSDVLM